MEPTLMGNVDGFVSETHNTPSCTPSCTSAITSTLILQHMIAHDLRSGRLTPRRRKRLIRYASQVGVPEGEAAQIVAACRDDALQDADPEVRYHALRLVKPQHECLPGLCKLALAFAAAVALDLALVAILW